MDVDPKSLKLFARVMELGTIAEAAEREHIAAAAVSKRITEMERALGASLVCRSNKGLTPTAAGLALLDVSRRILNDLQSLPILMNDYARGLKGQARLLANVSSITQFLPEQLSAFMERNPLTRVHLQESLSSEIEHLIAENAADLGIHIAGSRRLEGLEYHAYQEDELMLIAPLNHALAAHDAVRFEETLEYNYIGFQEGTQLNLLLLNAATGLGRSWICRMQVNSFDALCHMVEAGLGIAVMPRRLALSYAKALRVAPIDLQEQWTRRKFAICCRPYREMSNAARRLLDHLLDGATIRAAAQRTRGTEHVITNLLQKTAHLPLG